MSVNRGMFKRPLDKIFGPIISNTKQQKVTSIKDKMYPLLKSMTSTGKADHAE
jgi:hypothetical protein